LIEHSPGFRNGELLSSPGNLITMPTSQVASVGKLKYGAERDTIPDVVFEDMLEVPHTGL
jgi:hypothetical protein